MNFTDGLDPYIWMYDESLSPNGVLCNKIGFDDRYNTLIWFEIFKNE